MAENASHITLNIFASLEFIAFLLRDRPFMDNPEMVSITGTIYNAAILQDIIRYCDKRGTASTCLHLVHIFVPGRISNRLNKIQTGIVVVIESTHLITQATINTPVLIYGRI